MPLLECVPLICTATRQVKLAKEGKRVEAALVTLNVEKSVSLQAITSATMDSVRRSLDLHTSTTDVLRTAIVQEITLSATIGLDSAKDRHRMDLVCRQMTATSVSIAMAVHVFQLSTWETTAQFQLFKMKKSIHVVLDPFVELKEDALHGSANPVDNLVSMD
jgi:hypothetical protein